jgi:hypothetical protein
MSVVVFTADTVFIQTPRAPEYNAHSKFISFYSVYGENCNETERSVTTQRPRQTIYIRTLTFLGVFG